MRGIPRRLTRPACWLLAVAALVAAGCRRPADDVPIGHVAALTGPSAAVGVSADEGVQLALDEINAAGGVLGKKVRVVTEDDHSKIEDAVTAVLRLVKQERVVALIAEAAGDRSLAAAPLAQDNRVPAVSPASTTPQLTALGDYVFRACWIDDMQGAAMAAFATQSLKHARFAILSVAGQDASSRLARGFRDAVHALGGTVVVEQSYGPGDVDFRGQLRVIAAANPDALYLPGQDTDVALVARQARELGLAATLLGADGGGGPKTVELGGRAVEGAYFTTHWSAEEQRPEVQKFVADYRARYGGKTPDAVAALAYDATKMLVAAMVRAGSTDGPAVRDALAATRDFAGVTGRITLDAQRNARKPVVVVRLEEGRPRFIEAVLPRD